MIHGLGAMYAAVLGMLMPVFAVTAVGAAWGHRKIAYPGLFVSTLVTLVATPSLVFHTLVTTKLSTAILANVVAAAALGILVMGLMNAVLLKLCRFPVRSLVPTTTFPNAGNLGLPLSQLAFGDAGLSVAVAFFAATSFLQHTAGVYLLTAHRTDKRGWFSPVMLAAVLALLFRVFDVSTPSWVLETTRMLGSLTIPLMLIALGHTLVTISHAGLRDGLWLGMMRLVVGVAGGALVVRLLHLPPDIAGVTLFQMMMPVAVVNYMYAQRFTDHADATAGAVLASTLVFLIFCPLAFWFVGANLS